MRQAQFVGQQPQQPQILRQVRMILVYLLMIPSSILQPAVQTIPTPVAAQPGQRRNLSLTKDQMLEAQEMFRTANKVTRPEKALILGFMAGSRFVLFQVIVYSCKHLHLAETPSLSSSGQHCHHQAEREPGEHRAPDRQHLPHHDSGDALPGKILVYVLLCLIQFCR